MQIERTLIDLARLEALDFSKAFFGFGDGEFQSASLVGSPCHHALPAAVARDPRAIGCVVGRCEGGAATLIALTFDGKSIGHYTLPRTEDSAAEQLTRVSLESSACVARQSAQPEPSA